MSLGAETSVSELGKYEAIDLPDRREPSNAESTCSDEEDNDTGYGYCICVDLQFFMMVRKASKDRQQQEADCQGARPKKHDSPPSKSINEQPGERHQDEI